MGQICIQGIVRHAFCCVKERKEKKTNKLLNSFFIPLMQMQGAGDAEALSALHHSHRLSELGGLQHIPKSKIHVSFKSILMFSLLSE